MISEDYVTFEQAKLLKEKGFPQSYLDLPESTIWKTEGGTIYNPRNVDMEGYAIPIISSVQKWLREEKNININVYYIKPKDYGCDVIDTFESIILAHNFTYEEALSAGIDKALKLI